MRLVTYDRRGHRRLGALTGGRVVDLPDAVGHPAFPTTMESLLAAHRGTVLDAAREALVREDVDQFGVPDPRILVPVLPASIRAFPRPASGTATLEPAGYRTLNHRAVSGPEEEVEWPSFSERLDFDLCVACVTGSWGRNLSPGRASDRIFGYTLMNDWVARDEESLERESGSGSGRSRDFATSLGPVIVTADAIGAAPLELTARVNGEVWGDGELAELDRTFSALIAHASEAQDVWPADIFSVAVLEGACTGVDTCLPARAVVELEGSSIGVLRNSLNRPTRF